MSTTSVALCRGRNGEPPRGMLGLRQGLTHLHIHFYQPLKGLPLEVSLWHRLCRPRFIHCTVELDRVVLWDQPLRSPGGWFRSEPHKAHRPPDATVSLPPSLWRVVDLEGQRTRRVGSAVAVALRMLGLPHWTPLNCATTSAALVGVTGVLTPDDLWSALCRSIGTSEPR